MKNDDPQFVSVLAMSDSGPAPEAAIVRDLIKRGVFVAPVLIGAPAFIWGANGAWSAAYGLAIVLGNFAVAAWMVSYTAKISYALMMGATLFGYIVATSCGWQLSQPPYISCVTRHGSSSCPCA